MSLKENYAEFLRNLAGDNENPELLLSRELLQAALTDYEKSPTTDSLRVTTKLLSDTARLEWRIKRDNAKNFSEEQAKKLMDGAVKVIGKFLKDNLGLSQEIVQVKTVEFLKMWQEQVNA